VQLCSGGSASVIWPSSAVGTTSPRSYVPPSSGSSDAGSEQPSMLLTPISLYTSHILYKTHPLNMMKNYSDKQRWVIDRVVVIIIS